MEDVRLSGDLNRGRLFWRLVTFGIPLVLGMFFHGLFNLVDLIIVGPLGPYALAAVNQASLVNMFPMVIAAGVNNASIAVISRNFGMRNYNRANANALQSFLLLAILAVVLGWPSYAWATELNQLVGSQGEALAPANDYLRISSAGLFTMFALMQVTAVLRAGGNAHWPMILIISANFLNVGLTLALVYGWWIFPQLGVAGAAWGTVIARGIFAVFGLYLITRRSSPVRLILRRPRPRLRMLWNLTRIGIPSSMQFVVRVIAYGALMRFGVEFGDGEAMHAALAAGFRLDMLATFAGAGWGAAAAAMVGQALGAGWIAAILNAVMLTGIGIAYGINARWLMQVFGEDPGKRPEFALVFEYGIEFLRIAVVGYAFAGIGITLAQALNGAGSTKMPLTLDAFGFVFIMIPLAAHIARHHGEEGYGRPTLWWSMVGVAALVSVLYVIVWARGHWKHKKIQ